MRKSAFMAVLLVPFALSACGDDGTSADTGDDTTSGTEAPTQTTNEPDSSTTDDPTDTNGCTPDDQCRTADDCLPGQTCLANCTCFGEPSGDTDACYADQGAYGDCVAQGAGACENGAGAQCAQGGGGGICFFPCNDVCDCPAPPDGASVGCEAFILDNPNNYCHLDCSGGKACPTGMTCFSNYLCIWPAGGGNSCAGKCGVFEENAPCQCDSDCVDFGDCCNDICTHCAATFPEQCEPPTPLDPPAYHDCANNPVVTCGENASCTSMSENDDTWAVCSQTGCTDANDCADAPGTGNAPVACGDLGDGDVCYLDCANQETCPDGMECTPEGYCAWEAQGFLLLEDFGYGQFRAGWTVIDVDGFTPQLPYITDAWVVTDNIVEDFAAVSTSWYDPEGQAADDWMITPQLSLGPNSVLSWRALAQDPDFPDGYEVRISTTTPDVAGFTANAAVFSIAAEESGRFTERSVNLADHGYTNVDVYIAFRNNSNDQFLLFVDDISVTR